MVTGVFHADPHPGNVLLLADGRLGLLDFGSVGRLDGSVRAALQRLLLAMDRGDPLGASDALLEVVLRPDEVDTERLERDARPVHGQVPEHRRQHRRPHVQRPVPDRDRPRAVDPAGGRGASSGPWPPSRARSAQLAPGFDLVAEARAFAAGQGPAQALDPATARQLVTDELTTLLPMLRRLPRRLERIAGAAEHGRLSVQVRLFADQRDRRHLTGLLHQVLLTILAATAGIMAVLLLGTAGGPSVTATVSLYQLLGYNLLVVCAILALRVLVLIFRPERP